MVVGNANFAESSVLTATFLHNTLYTDVNEDNGEAITINGLKGGTSYSGGGIDTAPVIFTLPYAKKDGTLINDARLNFGQGTFTGICKISMLNGQTEERDYTEILCRGMSSKASFTLAAPVNNGDTEITLVENAEFIFGFSAYMVGNTLVYVRRQHFTDPKKLVLVGPVTGLTGTVASGTTISRPTRGVIITPLTNNWVTISRNVNNLKFVLASPPANLATAASILISAQFSQAPF